MRRLFALLVMPGICPPAVADEGMWTLDAFPAAVVHERYGVPITPEWLRDVRQATVRLEDGCSGSFASPRGLVLTNHHCVAGCLAQLSRADRDLLAEGFLARTPGTEERCPTEQVSVLERIEDVTARVQAEVGAADDAAANARRKALLTRLEEECEAVQGGGSGRRACEAVTLYGGGRYQIYHYRRYEDVRLVFAPESAVAFFGGDIDNFQFPRWNLDFALLRVYEQGRPVETPAYLRWRVEGAREGEAVFVAGHPGSTQRQETLAQLRFERDPWLTHWVPRAGELRGRYLQFAAGGGEQARVVQEPLFALENAFKVRRRQLEVLVDETFLARRADEERALRAALASPAQRSTAVEAFADVERALAVWRDMFDRHQFIEMGAALQGELAGYARVLVRAAGERGKPNAGRQREYTEAALPLLQARLLAAQPVYPDLETLRLAFGLEKMVEYLGVDDPAVRAALGSASPRDLAARAVRETRLGDPAFRQQLWAGGRSALERSGDPLIDLAMRLEPEALQLRRRHDDEVEAVLARAGERLARARFAVYGDDVYPDATFTLRVSFGAVRGWRESGSAVAPFTDLGGLYRRTTGAAPFQLPARWQVARERLPSGTPFNFSTDNDIVGGNSGSPMLDAAGRLVGLVFDGNIHSIGGSFWFDTARNRTVAVHPAAMRLALQEVYGARDLLREMGLGEGG